MTHGIANMKRDKKSKGGKMKKGFFVASLVCFGMAGFCYWFNYTQVAPHSTKDILTVCRWASLFLGSFAFISSLSPIELGGE